MTSTLLPTPTARALNAPKIHQLANGLTIIAEQIPIDSVSLNVWFEVGSAQEPDAMNGMAHFLEHMIFKGTHRLRSGEFERLIEERGAVTNAATSQDYTYYYVTTAPQDFAALMPLQLDVVFNAIIPDQAFERERQVVLEEIRRSEDNPRRRVFQKSIELGFHQLPYRRPVLGPATVVEQLTAAQMRDFHRGHYHPAHATIVAVGNLPTDELVDRIATSVDETLSHRDSLGNSSDRVNLEADPPFDTITRQNYTDNSLQQARLVLTWRVPGMTNVTQTHVFDVLASILGYGRTARLVRDLREEQHLVSQISVSNMTYYAQGLFYIMAYLPAENLEVVEQRIIQHIESLHTEPVTPIELQRVRTQVANRFIFGNETPSDRAGMYGYYHAMLQNLQPALSYPSLIQSLTVEDLQQAAQNYLGLDRYGVLSLVPAATS